jgi:hypothetical protein
VGLLHDIALDGVRGLAKSITYKRPYDNLVNYDMDYVGELPWCKVVGEPAALMRPLSPTCASHSGEPST